MVAGVIISGSLGSNDYKDSGIQDLNRSEEGKQQNVDSELKECRFQLVQIFCRVIALKGKTRQES